MHNNTESAPRLRVCHVRLFVRFLFVLLCDFAMDLYVSGIYRHGYKPRYDNYITVSRKTNENGLICKNSLFLLYSNISN